MVEINNLTKSKIPKNLLENFIKKIFKKLKIKKDLSIAFVGQKRIKELNKKYLKREMVTDVLSFPGQNNFLGEIVISLPQAKKQAKKIGHSLKEELKILIIHGLLHLLGFDDKTKKEEKKMQMKEKELLN
ncbi:MAG: rRNA maturation RNase YbeY [Patescibacteria group bacterium]